MTGADSLEAGATAPAGSASLRDLPGWPVFAADEIDAAMSVLRAGAVNYWTGPHGTAFETEFAAYLGTAHAVAVSNGSVALGVALRALGIGPGTEVIVTPRSFIASASEIVLAGATPVFADVDPDSQNITPATVEPLLSRRTAGIMTVHLAGWPCDMPGFLALAHRRGIRIIEDCAQAHGASVDGRKVGAWGDIAAFSFCQDKIMTTCGEGGIIATSDSAAFERAWAMKDHGKDRETARSATPGKSYRWIHSSIGTNGRMTEIQAAVGRCQLAKLDRWVEARRRNAAVLTERLGRIRGLRVPSPPAGIRHAYYKYYFFVEPVALRPNWSRDRVVASLGESGVPVGTGVCPEIYLEKAFASHSSRPERRLDIARTLGETSVMLPVHPSLTPDHMHQFADRVDTVLAEAVR